MAHTDRHQQTKFWLIGVPACMWFGMALLVNEWATTAVGQDAGLKSLKRQPLPWYNAEQGQVQAVELQPRDEARSKLRSSIAKRKPPMKWDWLENLFKGWNWDIGGASIFYWLFWSGLAVVAGVLIAWAIRNLDLRPSLVTDNMQPARSLAQSVAQLPFQIDTSDLDFRNLASQAYQAGDYQQAIVWLFSHVLVALDQSDLIRLKKGKTNRQYLRELSRHRDLSSYYLDVMLPFEATFFGDHKLERSQFQICWNKLEKFENRVDRFTGGAV